MVLPFKKQFKEPIISGTKIHAIRDDKTNRWKAGKVIHMATGVRTKQYECFNIAECVSTQRIFITKEWTLEVSIDHRELSPSEILTLAKNDGFEGIADFENWFVPLIDKDENLCYSGKLIHWTDKRY